MNPTAVILLIGVCGFWVLFGVLVLMLFRLRKTLDVLEATLQSINGEIRTLSPAMEGTMRQLERTGEHIGRTATEVETLVHGINSRQPSPAAAGVIGYLPLAVSAFRALRPLFRDRRSKPS